MTKSNAFRKFIALALTAWGLLATLLVPPALAYQPPPPPVGLTPLPLATPFPTPTPRATSTPLPPFEAFTYSLAVEECPLGPAATPVANGAQVNGLCFGRTCLDNSYIVGTYQNFWYVARVELVPNRSKVQAPLEDSYFKYLGNGSGTISELLVRDFNEFGTDLYLWDINAFGQFSHGSFVHNHGGITLTDRTAIVDEAIAQYVIKMACKHLINPGRAITVAGVTATFSISFANRLSNSLNITLSVTTPTITYSQIFSSVTSTVFLTPTWGPVAKLLGVAMVAAMAANVGLDYILNETKAISHNLYCLMGVSRSFTITLQTPGGDVPTIPAPFSWLSGYIGWLQGQTVEQTQDTTECGGSQVGIFQWSGIFGSLIGYPIKYARQLWYTFGWMGVLGIFLVTLGILFPFVAWMRIVYFVINGFISFLNLMFKLIDLAYKVIALSGATGLGVFVVLEKLARWFIDIISAIWVVAWRMWDFFLGLWAPIRYAISITAIIAVFPWFLITSLLAFAFQMVGMVIGVLMMMGYGI